MTANFEADSVSRVAPTLRLETARPQIWAVIDGAYLAHGFPAANLPLLRRMSAALEIERFESIESRSYIKAMRKGDGPALQIHSGYTEGFVSEAEIVTALGPEVGRQPSSSGSTWWIWHPVNRIRVGDRRSSLVRAYGSCQDCGMLLPACERCDCAD